MMVLLKMAIAWVAHGSRLIWMDCASRGRVFGPDTLSILGQSNMARPDIGFLYRQYISPDYGGDVRRGCMMIGRGILPEVRQSAHAESRNGDFGTEAIGGVSGCAEGQI
jgi:hypothetical protein